MVDNPSPDIVKYCDLMEEIKLRMNVIDFFIYGRGHALYPTPTLESGCLQLRKVLELIAFGSLVANKGAYIAEEEARHIITSTALTHLEGARGEDLQDFAAVYDDLARRYTRRLASLSHENSDDDTMSNQELARYRKILGELLRLERRTAVRLRNEGRINDEVLRKIEHELDLSETRLTLS